MGGYLLGVTLSGLGEREVTCPPGEVAQKVPPIPILGGVVPRLASDTSTSTP